MKRFNLTNQECYSIQDLVNSYDWNKIPENSRGRISKKEKIIEWSYKSIDLIVAGSQFINNFFDEDFSSFFTKVEQEKLKNEFIFFDYTSDETGALRSQNKEFNGLFAILLFLLVENNQHGSPIYADLTKIFNCLNNEDNTEYGGIPNKFDQLSNQLSIILFYIDEDLDSKFKVKDLTLYKKFAKLFFKTIFLYELLLDYQSIHLDNTFIKMTDEYNKYLKNTIEIKFPTNKSFVRSIISEQDLSKLRKVYLVSMDYPETIDSLEKLNHSISSTINKLQKFEDLSNLFDSETK